MVQRLLDGRAHRRFLARVASATLLLTVAGPSTATAGPGDPDPRYGERPAGGVLAFPAQADTPWVETIGMGPVTGLTPGGTPSPTQVAAWRQVGTDASGPVYGVFTTESPSAITSGTADPVAQAGVTADTGLRSVDGVRSAKVAYSSRTSGPSIITFAAAARDAQGRPVVRLRRLFQRVGAPDDVDVSYGAAGTVDHVVGDPGETVVIDDFFSVETSAFPAPFLSRTTVGYTVNPDRPDARVGIATFNRSGVPETAYSSAATAAIAGAPGPKRLVAVDRLGAVNLNRVVVVVNHRPADGPARWTASVLAIGGGLSTAVSSPGRQAAAASAFPPVVRSPVRPADNGFALLTGPVDGPATDVEYRGPTGGTVTNFGDADGRHALPQIDGRYTTLTAGTFEWAYVGSTETDEKGARRPRMRRVSLGASYVLTVQPLFALNLRSSTQSFSEHALPGCADTDGFGEIVAAQRVFGLARCGDGALRVLALFEGPAAGKPTITTTVARNAAGRERIRASSLSVQDVFGPSPTTGASIDAIPLRGTPLRGTPLRGTPLRGTPLRGTPLRGTPLRGTPLRGTPLRGTPLRGTPLRGTPLRGTPLRGTPLRGTDGRTWEQLLIGTRFEGASLDDVTLGDVLDLQAPQIQSLLLSDIDFSGTTLANATLPGLLMAPIPLAALPTPAGGWCAFVKLEPEDCDVLDTSSMTLLDLELVGYDLDAYYAQPIPLTAGTVRAAGIDSPLGLVPLRELGFDETTLGEIEAGTVQGLLTGCEDACLEKTLSELRRDAPARLGTSTLGDLIRLLPTSGGPVAGYPDDLLFPITLVEVVGGIIEPGYLALEQAALPNLLDAADLRTDDLVQYSARLTVDCSQIIDARMKVQLSPGTRVVPGTVSLRETPRNYTTSLPTPTTDDEGFLYFDARDTALCTGAIPNNLFLPAIPAVTLTFTAEPGVTLGPEPATRSGIETQVEPAQQFGAYTTTEVDDSRDTGNGPDSARTMSDGDLYTGRIATADDVDWFTVDAPDIAGTPLTITLSHLPADADIAVYGADPTGGVTPENRRDAPLRQDAELRAPTTDADSAADVSDPEKQPDTQQDVRFPRDAGGRTLRAVSARPGTADERLELRTTAADAGRPLLVSIRGHAGDDATVPYVVRSTTGSASRAPDCLERPAAPPADGASGTFPSLPLKKSTKTLILLNQGRSATRFGRAATDAMVDRLREYARRPEVRGELIPVESDPGSAVNARYADWDAAPCSITAPQQIAREITQTIDRVARDLPELRHVVLVGSDDVLPQVRVPDRTVFANEAQYADQATVAGRETPTSAALRGGYVLSDDPYGDFDPESYRGGLRYVPDVGLGRLVETPTDVVTQLDQYAQAKGQLDLRTAYVSGYDFLKDGATEIADRLDDASNGRTVERQINDTFDTPELERSLELAGPGISSVGAHFSHTSAISAAAERGKRYAEVVKVADVDPVPGRLVLTIGCHSGLNDPDSALSGGGVLDWAQRTGQRGAVLLANTGFGYGDTAAVAYSERLSANVASYIAAGRVTVGQALLYAKQQYSSELLERTAYDVKASEEHTLYGLPTYRVGKTGTEADPAVPTTASIVGRGPDKARSVPRTFTSSAARTDDADGSHWVEPGEEPVVVAGRPLQPKLTHDVTPADGTRVHGALITGMTSRDVAAVTPRVSQPVVDHSEQEPAPAAGDVVFPASLTTLQTTATPDGVRDRLVVATGQYVASDDGAGPGTQRLFGELRVELLQSGSDDFLPPDVDDVSGVVVGSDVAFRATSAADDVDRGIVLYQDDATDTWHRTDLQRGPEGAWGARVPLAGDATRVRSFVVQLADRAGNVATASDKGTGFAATPPPPADPFSVATELLGSASAGAFLDLVRADISDFDTELERAGYQVDNGEPRVHTGTFTVASSEGLHTLEATKAQNDGRRPVKVVPALVDTIGPGVAGTLGRAPDVVHTETVDGTATFRSFYTAPVPVTWTCADAGAGPAGCPAPSSIAQEGLGRTVASGTVSDRAGRTGSATSDPIDLDLTAPVTGFLTKDGAVLTPGIAPVRDATFDRIRIHASDTVAGIAAAPELTFTAVPRRTVTKVRASLVQCDDGERRACTYELASGFPGTGLFDVTVTATDRAGRRTTSPARRFNVVKIKAPVLGT